MAVLALTYGNPPATVIAAIVRVARKLRWKVREHASRQIVMRSGMSVRSWGEEITVDVTPRKSGGTRLRAQSKILVGFWDWGKNGSNLGRLAGALDAEMARVRH